MSRKPKRKESKPVLAALAPGPAPTPGSAPEAESVDTAEVLAARDKANRIARENACAKAIDRVLAEFGCHVEVRPKYVPSLRRRADQTEQFVFETTVDFEVVAHGK